MNYPTGERVRLGDSVRMNGNAEGVVVCVLEDGGYSDAYPKSDWDYLEEGVLIDFPKLGLIHFQALDEDIVLIARAG